MRGLSFSQDMMIAWLAGRKSITRRLMKPQPDFIGHDDGTPVFAFSMHMDSLMRSIKPRYTPGEVVYIKETWAPVGEIARSAIELAKKWPYGSVSVPEYDGPEFIYKADWDAAGKKYVNKWKSPRFMPEWASRSRARIVSVRPERIQSITETDAKREGVTPMLDDGKDFIGWDPTTDEQRLAWGGNYRDGFRCRWHLLHPGSWEKNDWVWRIELEKI